MAEDENGIEGCVITGCGCLVGVGFILFGLVSLVGWLITIIDPPYYDSHW